MRMDNGQYDDLLRKHTPRLRSFVRGRVGNREDADDIVQETLYQFLRTINVLQNPILHVSSWLYTVAHNLIINNGRKHREESLPERNVSDDDSAFMSDLSDILVASDDESPDILMLRAMVWDELEKALAELPSVQRDAVILTEIKGLTVKQAAEITKVSVNTFLSRKHYAVLHIRKRLQVLYDELMN